MRLAPVIVILLLACGSSSDKNKPATESPPATTEDKATPEPEPEPVEPEIKRDPAAYKKALTEGRKLAATDTDQAIAAFERALAAMPEDAVALSELSWLHVKKENYDEAIKAGQRSVKAASNPKVKAMSLYNLGRAYEGQDKRKQAIDAYRKSNRLRPHRVVRGRLARLSGATAKQLLHIEPLEGPFKTYHALCMQQLEDYGGSSEVDEDNAESCGDPNDSDEDSDADGESPFLAMEMRDFCSEEFTKGRQCSTGLVVKVAKGWFVGAGMCTHYGNREECDANVKISEQDDKLLAATINYSNTETWYADTDEEIDMSSSQTLELYCGVGARGVPACVSFETEYSGRDENLKPLEYSIDATLGPGRKLTLRATGSKKKLPKSNRELLGKHKLVFP